MRTALLTTSVLTFLAGALPFGGPVALADTAPTLLVTGQTITPTAAPGALFQTLNPGLANYPNYRAGQAVKTAISPDGKTLLIMTSGYNTLNFTSGAQAGQRDPAGSNDYIFVYSLGANGVPTQKQVLQVPNAFVGLSFSPDGSKFFASGGVSDAVFTFTQAGDGTWSQSGTWKLNHQSFAIGLTGVAKLYGAFLNNGIGVLQAAECAGLAVTADGSLLAVNNIDNHSLSVIDTATGNVLWEYDLRPYNGNPAGDGVAGGEMPFGVAIAGDATNGFVAYVSSIRDREIVALPLGRTAPAASAVARIKVPGTPNSLLYYPRGKLLFATQDNSDLVAMIDTTTNKIIEQIPTAAPPGVLKTVLRYTGAAPNGVAISPDGATLYVTNGGANSVAVIPLGGPAPHRVAGLIPTGWYPHSVSVSADGKTLYVVNGKSDPGANPDKSNPASNQYVEQLEQAGFLTLPVPDATTLAGLTQTVIANNNYGARSNSSDAATMAFLRGRIRHVIYIIKENRTFDQILGDLQNGANADRNIVMYPQALTPNFHAIASNFVTLDNFYTSGEVSGDGWAWSTEGRESDFGVKTIPPNYANRGFQNDSEGLNRIINVALPLAQRIATFPSPGGNSIYGPVSAIFPGGTNNLFPGTNNTFATDGPSNAKPQEGYIWDAALRKGLSVRNYGMFIDLVRYNLPAAFGGFDLSPTPFAAGEKVAVAANPSLVPYTDPYYRGFDNAYPDTWRYLEWQREFLAYRASNTLPTLSLVRLMHDHTGNFCSAPPPYTASGCPAAGLNTPELQQADNDYAVGRLVQSIAKSRFNSNTLIFVLEDDSQDGPDHVNSHRSTAYIVGPYVKQKAVVSTRYNTVNMVRTIEDVLGIGQLNLNDAYARPMTDVFDISQGPKWDYTASPSAILRNSGLAPYVNAAGGFGTAAELHSSHDGAWWAQHTRGYDWSREDRIPSAQYNRVMWQGLKGDAAYPAGMAAQSPSRPVADRDGDGDND